jgi:hypothetical protein
MLVSRSFRHRYSRDVSVLIVILGKSKRRSASAAPSVTVNLRGETNYLYYEMIRLKASEKSSVVFSVLSLDHKEKQSQTTHFIRKSTNFVSQASEIPQRGVRASWMSEFGDATPLQIGKR